MVVIGDPSCEIAEGGMGDGELKNLWPFLRSLSTQCNVVFFKL